MKADTMKNLSKILKKPGSGLLTVSTGNSLATQIQKKYFSGWTPTNTIQKNPEKFFFLGFPCDTGGSICRGAAHGPIHLREHFFSKKAQLSQSDLGDIPIIPQLLHDSMINSKQKSAASASLWKSPYSKDLPVSPLSLLQKTIEEFLKLKSGKAFFILGGDHSLSYAPFAAFKKLKKTNLGVLHFDAHTDLMTSRYGIDFCFATWAAHASKIISNPDNFFQVGIRNSGFKKNYWENKFKIHQIWNNEIEKKPAEEVAQKIITKWKKNKIKEFYLSIDIDTLDSSLAPCTGTPEANGPNATYIAKIISIVSQEFKVIGGDLVEVAPPHHGKKERLKTLNSAWTLFKGIHFR